MATSYVLPTRGYMYSPETTLEAALKQWSHDGAQMEATGTPREAIEKPEWSDYQRCYITSRVQIVSIQHRSTKRGRWYQDQLVFGSHDQFCCNANGEAL